MCRKNNYEKEEYSVTSDETLTHTMEARLSTVIVVAAIHNDVTHVR